MSPQGREMPDVTTLAKCIVMVMAGGEGQRLYPLTKRRAKPAVRFAGAYRIIDFTLSNCVNSGLRRIYLLAQYASTSLFSHVRRGCARLLSEELGEGVEILPPQRMAGDRWYAGTADAVFQNLYLLQQERPDLVVLLSGDHAYKMDYRPMIAHHLRKKAALTISALAVPKKEAQHLGVLATDQEGRVVDFHEKPAEPRTIPGRPEESLVNMGVYVWDTRALVQEVSRDATQESSHDFGRDIIPAMVKRGEAVYAYEFVDPRTGEPAYWRDIGTIESYWESHMDLLEVTPKLDLYDQAWPLYTARGHHPPAKTVLGKQAQVSDSLLCEGCVVSGGQVERSVLSPGVRVGEGAVVVESIIFDDAEIGPGAYIYRAIIDEKLKIPEGYTIGTDPAQDAKRFVIIPSGITVVPVGAVFD
ncbi:MAG: glucose-1-phosphate adenylyltransferase [Armatimonadetes bacterium]|nr:glucose-1-phosphate adenylyltransferase [Armatimonadota bacterium]